MTRKTSTTEKLLYAARDFKDAGTGRSFEQGEVVDATEGELANYAAAGLVGEEKTPAQELIEDSHGTGV